MYVKLLKLQFFVTIAIFCKNCKLRIHLCAEVVAIFRPRIETISTPLSGVYESQKLFCREPECWRQSWHKRFKNNLGRYICGDLFKPCSFCKSLHHIFKMRYHLLQRFNLRDKSVCFSNYKRFLITLVIFCRS